MFDNKRLSFWMATDTMNPHCAGFHGDRYCQVIVNKKIFAKEYENERKVDCDNYLKRFLQDYGAPGFMVMDKLK